MREEFSFWKGINIGQLFSPMVIGGFVLNGRQKFLARLSCSLRNLCYIQDDHDKQNIEDQGNIACDQASLIFFDLPAAIKNVRDA